MIERVLLERLQLGFPECNVLVQGGLILVYPVGSDDNLWLVFLGSSVVICGCFNYVHGGGFGSSPNLDVEFGSVSFQDPEFLIRLIRRC